MAFSDWGSFVYRNGVRVPENQDAIYLDHSWHSILGTGEVKILGHKAYPYLFIADQERPIHAFASNANQDYPNECLWFGKCRGHLFGARRYDQKVRNQIVEAFLVEPAGRHPLTCELLKPIVWTTTFGFQIGQGFEEDNINARASVVRPLKDWKILFQYLLGANPNFVRKYIRNQEEIK